VKASDLGEFALIERLAGTLGGSQDREVVVGIGDDAAVYHVGTEYIIATTDTLVEGVHFLPDTDAHALGWKAMAVNLSDIAAMGGWPAFALVTLALPGEVDVAAIEVLYEGIRDMATVAATPVIGGDTVRAGELSVTVTVIGQAVQDKGQPLLLRRDAAKPGDAIAVTGTLGESAAGLRQLRDGVTESLFIDRHLRPQPRLAEAALAVSAGIRCGIDVSDGLLADVGHICERSGVGAGIKAEVVPMSAPLRRAYGDALHLACTGGEDYELVLVGPRKKLEAIKDEAQLTIIGEIVDHRDPRPRLLAADGRVINFEKRGWDAFKS
jgi:thiamine-monophosphate kinase